MGVSVRRGVRRRVNSLGELQPKYCNYVLGMFRAEFNELWFLGHLLSSTEPVQEMACSVHRLLDPTQRYSCIHVCTTRVPQLVLCGARSWCSVVAVGTGRGCIASEL